MRERWSSTQPTDSITLDHMIRHSATMTKATIIQLGGNTCQNETPPFLHVTWCNSVITWQTSENAFQNRWVPLFHFTRPNHPNQSNQSYNPHCTKKWSFPLRISSVNVTSDLVTFTEEILNGKLHFLCSALNLC